MATCASFQRWAPVVLTVSMLGLFWLSLSIVDRSVIAQQPDRGRLGLPPRDERHSQDSIYSGSYALLVGTSEYELWPRLPGVREDIRSVRGALEQQGFVVEELLDPTRQTFGVAAESFINRYGLDPRHRLLFYFAGHGYTRTLNDNRIMGYLVMKNAPQPSKDIDALQQWLITMDEIETYARRILARHALFVFDSCFSGTVLTRGAESLTPFVRDVAMQPVRQFITSGTAEQTVPDRSVFREFFVRGIGGEADKDNDGFVIGSELASFLQKEVTNYSLGAQTPQYGKIRDVKLDRGDFIFVVGAKPLVAESKTTFRGPTVEERLSLAEEAFHRNDYESLARAAEEVLRLDSRNARAHRFRGTVFQHRDVGRTAREADEVLKILASPSSSKEFEVRGWAYHVKRDYDRAIADLDSSIRLEPTYAIAYLSRGNAYRDKKDPELAVADYTEAIRLEPTLAPAHNHRGVARADKKDYDPAIIDYTEAIRLDPKYAAAYFNRANAFMDKEYFERAIRDYAAAIRIDPEFARAYMGRGLAYADVDRGPAYARRDDYDLALADYTKALRLDPTITDVGLKRTGLGLSSNVTANGITAIRLDATATIRLNIEDPVSRGNAFNWQADYEAAISSYTEAIRLDPRNVRAVNNRGYAYAAKKDYDAAIADYTEAIRLDPKDAFAFNNRGYTYMAKTDHNAAIADYTEAIHLDPGLVPAYRGRGLANRSKKDYDAAIADYSEVVSLVPGDSDAHKSRALAYFSKNAYLSAITDYTEVIRLNPKSVDAYYGRGLAYAGQKDYLLANADYSNAIRLDGKRADAYKSRAVAYREIGLFGRAEADEKMVGSVAPYLIAEGRFDDAIQSLDQVLSIDRGNGEAKTYLTTARFYRDGLLDMAREGFAEAFRAEGGASFMVDHVHVVTEKRTDPVTDYCRGWLDLRKGQVSFTPQDGYHGFRSTNKFSLLGSSVPYLGSSVPYLGSSVRNGLLNLRTGGKDYYFSPRSRAWSEVQLIEELYKGFVAPRTPVGR